MREARSTTSGTHGYRTGIFLILSAIAFFPGGIKAANAKSLLDSILYVALGGGLIENKDTRIATTQSDNTLRSTTQVVGLRPMSTMITRIGPCAFEIELHGTASDGDYRLDLSQAQFDTVQAAESRNVFGHRIQVLSIPGAKFCLMNGQDYANPGVKPGNCADHYNAGPVSHPQGIEDMRAEIRNIRDTCNALSFDAGPNVRHFAMK